MGFNLPLLNRRRRSGGDPIPLSPVDLFSTGAQGVWYDTVDLTTMFQESTGITPVTAPGQSVGLRLDKSKGLVLGAELVLNGTFDTDIANWTVVNPGVTTTSVSASGVTVTNNGTDGQGIIRQTITSVVGKTYKLQLDITSTNRTRIAGTGGFFLTQAIRNGTVSVFAVATGTTLTLDVITFDAGGVATFDNISVKELPGNHSLQAVTNSRLTYGIEPKTGTRNIIQRTEEFENAVWTKTGTTVTVDTIAAPNGATTADKLVETAVTSAHSVAPPALAYAAATQYTLSAYFKAAERTWAYLLLSSTPFGATTRAWFDLSALVASTVQNCTAVITDVGDGWRRCSITATTTVGGSISAPATLGVAPSDATSSYLGVLGSGLYVWGAQLELGSAPSTYQRVGSAFDVTEAGVASCPYLQYDGTDDSMGTASAIDFTGTDAMSVFTGIFRRSDATLGTVLEFGTDSTNNNGSFALRSPNTTASSAYSYVSRGTALSLTTSPASFSAPRYNLLTGLSDISADQSVLRVNGVQVSSNTTDQGTGTYANQTLFSGRRNNTSLPFSGRDYGMLVVGKNATAAEITFMEAWFAARTPTVTL